MTRRSVGDAAAGLGLYFLRMSEGPFSHDAGQLKIIYYLLLGVWWSWSKPFFTCLTRLLMPVGDFKTYCNQIRYLKMWCLTDLWSSWFGFDQYTNSCICNTRIHREGTPSQIKIICQDVLSHLRSVVYIHVNSPIQFSYVRHDMLFTLWRCHGIK